MTFLATQKQTHPDTSNLQVLLSKLDEAIDDLEAGRVEPLEEAWQEIDAI